MFQTGRAVVRRSASAFRFRPTVELIQALVYRDFTARYRRSWLGLGWAFLQPLFQMVIFNIIRGVMGFSTGETPYMVFSFAGLLPWTFFSRAVTGAAGSIRANANVIKKMAMPREVFPLAAIAVSFIDFAIAALIMAGMMLAYNVSVNPLLLLWLPLLLAIEVVLAFAIGMSTAALGTYRQDVILAISFVMQFWLYATPIMYPLDRVPESWAPLYRLNPMAGVVEGFRNVLVDGHAPPTDLIVTSAAISLALLAVAWPVFRWLSAYFADVV